MSDVVVFVGPPLTGRTEYYHQELHDYHRISASEIYAKDSSANLRIIIKNIVSELHKGHKVVIDDENIDRRTRLSYINGISKKVPGTTFDCYQFVPLHGTTQLHIFKEWHLARQSLTTLLSHGFLDSNIKYLKLCDVSSRMDSYSAMTKDLCLDVDRYQVSKQVTVPLVCHSSHKLTCPLLIVHWEGMIDGKIATANPEKGSLRKGVCETLRKWSTANKNGHIVIVCETGDSNMKKLISGVLLPLANDLSLDHPINYVVLGDLHDPGRSPATGIVVWLEYMFACFMHHKTSLYIYHTKAQLNCAQTLFMRSMSASKVFGHPRSVNGVHYTEHEVHHIHHNVVYVTESPSSSPSSSSSKCSRCLPLYQLTKLLACSPENNTLNANYDDTQLRYSIEYNTDPMLSGRHVSADVGAGRTLGMLYKDIESFERFQQSWQQSLEPVFDTKVNNLSGLDPELNSGSSSSTTFHDEAHQKKSLISDPSMIPKEEVSGSQDSMVSATFSRSLPTWIEGCSQDISHQSELELPSTSAPKRAKCDSSITNEPKPLTEEELLITAEEVLAQHKATKEMTTFHDFHQTTHTPSDGSKSTHQHSPIPPKSLISTSKPDTNRSSTTTHEKASRSATSIKTKSKVDELSTESILDALFT